jgi:parvulin-like peptidyl-prolyl isomerase
VTQSRRDRKKAIREQVRQASVEQGPKRRWTGLIIAVVVAVIVGAIFGVFYYQTYVAPFQRTVITVDDIEINMDYFLKRAILSGRDSMSVLEMVTEEQLIKLEAPNYGIEVTEDDIDQELRRVAEGESGTISDSEFKEWYRQKLNETDLSNSEYREFVTSYLLGVRLQEYLAERTPTVAPHVHLHVLVVETLEEAQAVRARWENGESFADLAREVSLDIESAENGGDIGWIPYGISEWIDFWAFDLEPGEVSEPLAIGEADEFSGFQLLMVSEKVEAREMDEYTIEVKKSQALGDWLLEVMTSHNIS